MAFSMPAGVSYTRCGGLPRRGSRVVPLSTTAPASRFEKPSIRVYSSPKPTQPDSSTIGEAKSRPENLSRRDARLFSVETGGGRPYSQAAFEPGDALLFGPETRGLPSQVIAQVPRERQLAIPMCAGNRSLNLSNAVALVVYEAWRQNGFTGASASQ